jgi:hypothetical protein
MISAMVSAQDTIQLYKQDSIKKPFSRVLYVPAIMIGYGVASLKFQGLRNVNTHLNKEVFLDGGMKPIHIDNYLQYAPGFLVYGLNLVGIKGKNNLVDRSVIYAMSNLIMCGTVMATKNAVREWRPDRADRLSFPSGHTATAFAAAEFMRQEYKDVSPWYGVAGYAMAATTGYLRMYNNKHWLSDVVAGAGVGILSTDVAYYIYPSVKRLFTGEKKNGTTVVMPTYQQGAVGISILRVFN